MVAPTKTPAVDLTSDEKKPCMDVIEKNGYDVFSFEGAKRSIPDLAALEAEGGETNGCWPHLLSDVYSSLYKPKPTEREESEAPEAHKRLIQQTMESVDYDSMRTSTRLNRVGAAIATLELGEELLKQLPAGEPKRDENDPSDEGWDRLEGCKDDGDQGRKIRSMVRSAKRRASETMETLSALGWGQGAGNGGEVDLAEAARLSRRLRQDDKLQKIAQLAGRMRRLAMSKRKTRLRRQPEEVVGVELGRDLQRAVPSELAFLNTALGPDVLLRWAQGQLLQYKMEGTDVLASGPIVVCIDESGSMRGEREIWAKALALGLLAIAQREKRAFAIVPFASRTQCEVFDFGKGASMALVLKALDHFFSGGTSFERPLGEAAALITKAQETGGYDPMARADVIMITDGDCQVSPAFAAEFKRSAAVTRAHLYTIYVGTDHRSLDDLSDGVAAIRDLTNDGEALDLAFGI